MTMSLQEKNLVADNENMKCPLALLRDYEKVIKYKISLQDPERLLRK